MARTPVARASTCTLPRGPVGGLARHKPRPAQARQAAAGPRGGRCAAPALDEPASPVAGVEASGRPTPTWRSRRGGPSTADVVAGASPLRPSSGSAPRGGAAGARAAAGPEPVRRVVPTAASPFAPGREVAFARVQGDLLAGLGVRDGDHVALWRRDTAEPGDLAAVLDATGRAGLWRVYPERDELADDRRSCVRALFRPSTPRAGCRRRRAPVVLRGPSLRAPRLPGPRAAPPTRPCGRRRAGCPQGPSPAVRVP
jgi:hypothetical protein